MGGSPCTYWSVAQKQNRETEATGHGWELFKNYLIAKEKFQPDLFLYENNKSAAQPIKDQISHELGVDLMHINSALVSAQNRWRFYAFNWRVEQPEDRGILLRDVLEPSPLEINYELETVGMGWRGRMTDGKWVKRYESNGEQKANALTTCQTDSMVGEPVRIGTIKNNLKNKKHASKQYRVYSVDGKSTTLCGEGGGVGAKTGLYMCPKCLAVRGRGAKCKYEVRKDNKANSLTTRHRNRFVIEEDAPSKKTYAVRNGRITVDDREYAINVADGDYVIRKLTPVECERLQTLPDGYTAGVSNAQRYRGLGNGWTAEVIIHILNGALKDVPRDEKIVVLSMYDGIGTGRYCLDKMGFTNVAYYAFEIDKYAMQVSSKNYPDIVHLGDAFGIRSPDWQLPREEEEECAVEIRQTTGHRSRQQPEDEDVEKQTCLVV